MKLRYKLLILVFAVCGASGELLADSAFAADQAKMLEKWDYVLYNQCIVEKRNNTPIQAQNSGRVASAVFSQNSGGKLLLPSYDFGGAAGPTDCHTLFNDGVGNLPSIVSKANNAGATWDQPGPTDDFLTKLGYKDSNTYASDAVFNIEATLKVDGQQNDARTVPIKTEIKNGKRVYTITNNQWFNSLKVQDKNDEIVFYTEFYGCTNLYGDQKISVKKVDDYNRFLNDLKSKLATTWGVSCPDGANADGSTIFKDYIYTFNVDTAVASRSSEYVYPDGVRERPKAAETSISNMSGMNYVGLEFDNNEFYALYKYYMEAATAANGGAIDCESGNAPSHSNYITVELKQADGSFKECYADFKNKDPRSISVNTMLQGKNLLYPIIRSISMRDIENWFQNVDQSTLTDVDLVTNNAANSGGQNGLAAINCINSGAGQSLGWILCPVVDLVANATQTIYEGYLEPALQVDPKLFSDTANSGTRQAWGAFQLLANTLFIILFLMVIFSQITGYGIDNYGIKKILPKLIITAILINLSYVICLVFIDLSNILGNAFQTFFNSLPPNAVNTNVNGISFTPPVGAAGAVIFAVLLVALVTQMWPLVQTGSVGIIIGVLMVALSVIIAVLFLFMLLAAREAVIVVLTVISPLAFACFILPNTKSLFDKWLNAGKAMLLVYPICGLLIGGGNYVSKLILAAGSGGGGQFFTAFVAILVGVVPIFFIPAVLKSSFNALGSFGAKLSGMGKTLGGRITGGAENALKGTERYKQSQFEVARRRQERGARSTVRRMNNRAGRRNLTSGEMLQQARAQETLDKMQRENYAAQAIGLENEAKGWSDDQYLDEWRSLYTKGDDVSQERLRALTTVMQNKFGPGAASMIGGIMMDSEGPKVFDDEGKPLNTSEAQGVRASLATLNDMKRHDSTFNQIMSSKASDAYDMINAQAMDNGKGHNASYFSSGQYSSKDATKNTDLMTQSGGTLKRMAAVNSDGTTGISNEMLMDLAYGTSEAHKAFQSDEGKMSVINDALAARGLQPPTQSASVSGSGSSGSHNVSGHSGSSGSFPISHNGNQLNDVIQDLRRQGGGGLPGGGRAT